ncbi:hypothetical protein PIB30_076832 [Stylosanthes scabra]|uniref:Uncharacterized protein n=1 Tax=Stylosanthes scabra TaxID=79078 RepID=A0ABU6UPB1_9FABA|nr:hypothetical protein [Stylosanthes scabra]
MHPLIMRERQTRIISLKKCKNVYALKEESGYFTKMEDLTTEGGMTLSPWPKVERAVLIQSIIIGENINVEEIIADQFYKFIYKTDLSSSLPFPSIIAALCLDAKVTTLKDDTLINQELPIAGEALIRTREGRARNPRQEAPPPQ